METGMDFGPVSHGNNSKRESKIPLKTGKIDETAATEAAAKTTPIPPQNQEIKGQITISDLFAKNLLYAFDQSQKDHLDLRKLDPEIREKLTEILTKIFPGKSIEDIFKGKETAFFKNDDVLKLFIEHADQAGENANTSVILRTIFVNEVKNRNDIPKFINKLKELSGGKISDKFINLFLESLNDLGNKKEFNYLGETIRDTLKALLATRSEEYLKNYVISNAKTFQQKDFSIFDALQVLFEKAKDPEQVANDIIAGTKDLKSKPPESVPVKISHFTLRAIEQSINSGNDTPKLLKAMRAILANFNSGPPPTKPTEFYLGIANTLSRVVHHIPDEDKDLLSDTVKALLKTRAYLKSRVDQLTNEIKLSDDKTAIEKDKKLRKILAQGNIKTIKNILKNTIRNKISPDEAKKYQKEYQGIINDPEDIFTDKEDLENQKTFIDTSSQLKKDIKKAGLETKYSNLINFINKQIVAVYSAYLTLSVKLGIMPSSELDKIAVAAGFTSTHFAEAMGFSSPIKYGWTNGNLWISFEGQKVNVSDRNFQAISQVLKAHNKWEKDLTAQKAKKKKWEEELHQIEKLKKEAQEELEKKITQVKEEIKILENKLETMIRVLLPFLGFIDEYKMTPQQVIKLVTDMVLNLLDANIYFGKAGVVQNIAQFLSRNPEALVAAIKKINFQKTILDRWIEVLDLSISSEAIEKLKKVLLSLKDQIDNLMTQGSKYDFSKLISVLKEMKDRISVFETQNVSLKLNKIEDIQSLSFEELISVLKSFFNVNFEVIVDWLQSKGISSEKIGHFLAPGGKLEPIFKPGLETLGTAITEAGTVTKKLQNIKPNSINIKT